jgi:hypothetical protein
MSTLKLNPYENTILEDYQKEKRKKYIVDKMTDSLKTEVEWISNSNILFSMQHSDHLCL